MTEKIAEWLKQKFSIEVQVQKRGTTYFLFCGEYTIRIERGDVVVMGARYYTEAQKLRSAILALKETL